MNKITLYHTTTEFYLPSIKKEGLGKINPNETLGILSFIREVFRLSKTYLNDDTHFKEIFFTTEGMVNQTRIGSFNFKHSKTYLSISEQTAIRYALNKYGSELLSRSVMLYEMLKKKGVDSLIDTSILSFDLNSLINGDYKKLLLKVNNISLYDIETEHGENAVQKINEINKLKNTDFETYSVLRQQFNFALVKSVPFENIEVYNLKIKKIVRTEIEYELENYVG